MNYDTRAATSPLKLEIRNETEPWIRGTVIQYGAVSVELGGFRETFARGSLDTVMQSGPDLRLLNDHDTGRLLGRSSSGTLRTILDDAGLRFEAQLPDTTEGRDTLTLIKRGDLTGVSFGFRVSEDEWQNTDEGLFRTVTEVESLVEVSLVAFPAYESNILAARSAMQAFTSRLERQKRLQTLDRLNRIARINYLGAVANART